MGMKPPDGDEIPVSGTDELTVESEKTNEHVRKFGEYKATNTPLSAQELKDREAGGQGRLAALDDESDSRDRSR